MADEDLLQKDNETLIGIIASRVTPHVPILHVDQRRGDPVGENELPGYLSVTGSPFVSGYRYVILVTGDIKLLKLQPNSAHLLSSGKMPLVYMLDNNTVEFFVDHNHGTNEQLEKDARHVIQILEHNAGQLSTELTQYVAGLQRTISNNIVAEKERRQQERQRKEDLRKRMP